MKPADAERLARQLMDRHGLFAQGWVFRWDQAVRRFGLCSQTTRTIYLSRPLTELNPEHAVRDVLLHEIAHALAPPSAHHGPVWKTQAAAIGANPARTYDDDVVTPPARFVGLCPGCGRFWLRHRRHRIACGYCCRRHNGGAFDERFLIRWHDNRDAV